MTGYGHLQGVRRRLRRIQGQVLGLQRMVRENTFCIDLLTQISAATAALQSCAVTLLDEHINHCVEQAISLGGDEAREKVAEASEAIARLIHP